MMLNKSVYNILKNDFLFFRSLLERALYVDFVNKKKFRFLKIFSNTTIAFLQFFISKLIVFAAKSNYPKKKNIILITDYIPNINKLYNFESELISDFDLIFYSKVSKNNKVLKRDIKIFLLKYLLKNIHFDSLIFDCKALIIFEGDRPSDMIRGFIAKSLNKKVILIERSAYIFNKINPNQSNYQITNYLSYSNTLINRIRRFSQSNIKWHLVKDPHIRIENIDNLKSKKINIYFVGQPYLNDPKDYFFKIMQPLSSNEYEDRISGIFDEIYNSNKYNIFYIRHPCEDKPKFFNKNIKIISLKNLTINYRDIVIGFCSSLLYQYYSCGIRIVLLGDNYNKLIFEILKENNPLMKHFPITNKRSLFLPFIENYEFNSKLNSKFNNDDSKDFSLKIKEIL